MLDSQCAARDNGAGVRLAAEFPGSEQVITAGLATADDRAVWVYAAAHGLAVVSKDADFAQLSAVLGPPPKVIWLRIGNGPTRAAESLFGLFRARVLTCSDGFGQPALVTPLPSAG